MNVRSLAAWITAAAAELPDCVDELTELDSVAGDGDLGVTVSRGAAAVVAGLGDGVDTIPQLLSTSGAAFARGNPSTFAALTGSALMAAATFARTAAPGDALDRDAVVGCLRAAADIIAKRGGAEPGDRTVLDALLPSIDALAAADPGLSAGLAAMVAAAERGVEATRGMSPAKGRAAWTGERGVGHADAGATAYLRFVQALADTEPRTFIEVPQNTDSDAREPNTRLREEGAGDGFHG